MDDKSHRPLRTPDHRIKDVRYAAERIDCTCGVVVTGERDDFMPDRHEPLVEAWIAHRRAAGQSRVGMERSANGKWQRRAAA